MREDKIVKVKSKTRDHHPNQIRPIVLDRLKQIDALGKYDVIPPLTATPCTEQEYEAQKSFFVEIIPD